MTGRPLSWDLVGLETDPVPASENDVDEVVRAYSRRGQSLAHTSHALERLCAVDDWSGQAARSFADHARQSLSLIGRAEGECVRVASVLRAYASDVEEARTRTARAVSDAEHADARRRSAEAVLHDPRAVLFPALGGPAPVPVIEQAKLSAAQQDLADARKAAATAVAQLVAAAQSTAAQIRSSTTPTDAALFAPLPVGTPSDQLKDLVDFARSMGQDPSTYAGLLQQMYVTRAAEKAGIDLTTWDVSGGVAAVHDQYERAYGYYASLYLNNPNFQWAGMASMIGPSFAAGFEDLDQFQCIAKTVAEQGGKIPDFLLPPAFSQLDEVAGMSEDELRFYQTTLLRMQKDIFYDASTMHEAYIDGGMNGIEELAAAGLLGSNVRQKEGVDQAVQSWRNIDAGIKTHDKTLLSTGNEGLLRREQYFTINEQYRNMRDHPRTGEAMTYLMGLVGQPSIPGAHTLGHVDKPLHLDVDLDPLARGIQGEHVTINIPRANIANFSTRWALIKDDTLPAFNRLITEDPDRADRLLSESFRSRTNDMRLSKRWPQIAGGLVEEDWSW